MNLISFLCKNVKKKIYRFSVQFVENFFLSAFKGVLIELKKYYIGACKNVML